MDGGNRWREHRRGPSDERHEWARQPKPKPTDVAAHVDAGAQLGEAERRKCAGEEDREEEQRDAAELATET